MPSKIHPFAAIFFACCAMLAGATDIRWSSSDTFAHTLTLAPGKSAELCSQIEPRLPVDWRYAADGPLSFNIHRHAGDEVVYAVRSYLTKVQQGTLKPTFNFEWCWMWTNESNAAVNLQVDLKR